MRSMVEGAPGASRKVCWTPKGASRSEAGQRVRPLHRLRRSPSPVGDGGGWAVAKALVFLQQV
jgi:hypothetical protein